MNWADFIKFNGIEYTRSMTNTDRPLTDADLGPEFARVQFRVQGNVCDLSYRTQDGHAAYLDRGTPVYSVEGYRPEFRLAARNDNGELVLYEVLSNPYARRGQDLLDIGGKVRFISIARAEDNWPEVARIDNAQQVNRLVQMLLDAPLTARSNAPNERVYPLVFQLNDGTRVVRGVNLDAHTVGEFAVSEEFGKIIEQTLAGQVAP